MLPPTPFYKFIFWQRTERSCSAGHQSRTGLRLLSGSEKRIAQATGSKDPNVLCHAEKGRRSRLPPLPTSAHRFRHPETELPPSRPACSGTWAAPGTAAQNTLPYKHANYTEHQSPKKKSQKKNKSRGTNFTGTVRGTKRVPCQKPALTCTKKQDTFWVQKHTPDMCTTSLLWKPVLSGERKPNGKQEIPKHSTTSGEKQPLFAGKVLTLPPFPSSEGIAFYFDEAQLSFKWTTAEGDHC